MKRDRNILDIIYIFLKIRCIAILHFEVVCHKLVNYRF